MIPVTQTKVVVRNSKDEIVVNGNCWAAAIASILELSLDNVPNFEVWFKYDDYIWDDLTDRFLIRNGYTIEYAPYFKVFHPELLQEEINCGNFDCNSDRDSYIQNLKEEYKDKFYFVCGKSNRGVNHVTIWQNGVMVHDPHPTREGLLTLEKFEYIRPLTNEEKTLSLDYNNYKLIRFPIITK